LFVGFLEPLRKGKQGCKGNFLVWYVVVWVYGGSGTIVFQCKYISGG
jgi:hypothetical protein